MSTRRNQSFNPSRIQDWSIPEFHWVLLVFTGFVYFWVYWVLSGLAGFSFGLIGFFGFSLDLTGFYWSYRVSLSLSGLYPGFLLGLTGFDWVSLGLTFLHLFSGPIRAVPIENRRHSPLIRESDLARHDDIVFGVVVGFCLFVCFFLYFLKDIFLYKWSSFFKGESPTKKQLTAITISCRLCCLSARRPACCRPAPRSSP